MKVDIYSTTTCATCHLVTRWLDKQAISYTKLNTDESDSAMQAFMLVNDGNIGVPFTVITADDGSNVKIIGFDQAKFKHALGL